MPLVNFSNLDFAQVKTSLKEYLQANSEFTDYNFEGSNLSTILDVLAYNTYITSYNANMVANECFIDSATLREMWLHWQEILDIYRVQGLQQGQQSVFT